MPVGSVAVRQGCVILSFNAFSSSELDPETLAQVQQEIAEMTREWAVQEQLLSSDETERVSVQVCIDIPSLLLCLEACNVVPACKPVSKATCSLK